MWVEMFVFGGLWFWALLGAELCWLLGSSKYERGWAATTSLVVLALVLCFFGDFNVFSWIWHNPLDLLYGILVYFAVGAAWSFAKWWLLITNIRDRFEEIREQFLIDNKIADNKIPSNLRKAYFSALREIYSHPDYYGYGTHHRFHDPESLEDIRPKAIEHKARIMYWIGYWPFSALWTIFHDLLERIVTRIFRAIKEIFDKVSKRIWGNLEERFGEDFNTEGDPKPPQDPEE